MIQYIKIEGDLINLENVTRIRPIYSDPIARKEEVGVEFELRDPSYIPVQYFHTRLADIENIIRESEK